MGVQKIYGRPLNFKTRKAQNIRKIIYERDGFSCCDCGKVALRIPDNYTGELTLWVERGWLEIDHIVSRYHGGGNELSNLKTLCNSCNVRKGVK